MDKNKQQIQAYYDSLQLNYDSLMAEYQTESDTLPDELRSLYGQMKNMHQQMESYHQRMMQRKKGRHMKGKGMMGKGMQKNMKNRVTGEWYQQMMSMHDRMAEMHRNRGQEKMARMNDRLAKQFGRMMKKSPRPDKNVGRFSNQQAKEPSALDGANLFNRNCASCHGSQGEGITGTFPPVVNTEWITTKKSVPIRILLHGLTGKIEVNNRAYRGNMPAFGARLNNAETAAILNHLRSLSSENLPDISSSDVQEMRQAYRDRNRPWSADELKQ